LRVYDTTQQERGMRLKIAIGVYAKDVWYREFSRVVEVPIIPQIIRAGVLHLNCDEADEGLTYIVADETFYLYWEVEIKEYGSWESAATRLAVTAECLIEDGFVEDSN
jgi:hypothetical protein